MPASYSGGGSGYAGGAKGGKYAAPLPMAYFSPASGGKGCHCGDQKYRQGANVPPYSFWMEMQKNIDMPYNAQKKRDYRGA